jgi:hypothetical protein
VAEILNLQPRGNKAKAYQVKQVRGVIVSHRLAGEREGEPPPAQDSAAGGQEPDVPEADA